MISQYRKGTEIKMINFEEELKNFKPSLEVRCHCKYVQRGIAQIRYRQQ